MIRRVAAFAVATALAAASVASAGPPAIDYALNCQGCHRADGAGTPGSVPALAGSVGRIVAVPGGREFVARVPGVATSSLDDAALADVLNWVLARFDSEHVPPGFRPYTAEEVGRLRRDPLVNVARVRSELMERAEQKTP